MEPKINIMIADDQNLFAKLLKASLFFEPRFSIVALAQDGNEVVDLLEKTVVDVLLLDINMPKMDGLQVIAHIRGLYPELKIIILSNQSESQMIIKALQLGANAYMTKFAECEDVRDAIMKAYNGERYFCRTSFQNLMDGIANHPPVDPTGRNEYNNHDIFKSNGSGQAEPFINEANIECLTLREKEIFRLIVKGDTTKEISDKLFISTRTVETHRKNILQKLGVKNTLSLIKIAAGTTHMESGEFV